MQIWDTFCIGTYHGIHLAQNSISAKGVGYNPCLHGSDPWLDPEGTRGDVESLGAWSLTEKNQEAKLVLERVFLVWLHILAIILTVLVVTLGTIWFSPWRWGWPRTWTSWHRWLDSCSNKWPRSRRTKPCGSAWRPMRPRLRQLRPKLRKLKLKEEGCRFGHKGPTEKCDQTALGPVGIQFVWKEWSQENCVYKGPWPNPATPATFKCSSV